MKASSYLTLIVSAVATCGCASHATPERAELPPRPAPLAQKHDYQHRVLQETTEEARVEQILQLYGEKLAAQRAPRPKAPDLQAWERLPEPRRHRHPGRRYHYSHRAALYPHYYHGHRYHHRDHFSLGNTLFFGTLGGIIGHQSDHRDEGILIGAGYGLLRDLLRH
ncbi:MAG: hypothetical protein AAF581_05695 [Planctomycetota bacterium]